MPAVSSTTKYLSQYAEPETKLLATLPGVYRHCLCIPAFDETPAFIERTLTFLAQQNACLAIIVLNQPDSDTQASAHNVACKALLEQHPQLAVSWQNQHLTLYATPGETSNTQSALLLVDRFELGEKIPLKQGVGLARKIASDIALQKIADQCIQSSWIYSTDADVILPNNYFELPDLNAKQATAAFVLAYRHIAGDTQQVDTATQVYEQRLKAYVAGLRFAGSAYAFNTVGSTLCINAAHYAMVRGFPKRAAGEDFYLLNKLRKTGAVIELEQPCVEIISRLSHRTPFGTGQAVTEILNTDKTNSDNTNNDNENIFYHPQLFVTLKTVLNGINSICNSFNATEKSIDEWQSVFDQTDNAKAIISTLQALDFDSGLKHCVANSRDQKQFQSQMLFWLDGFKTLKCLHLLRDFLGYSNISLAEYQRLSPMLATAKNQQ